MTKSLITGGAGFIGSHLCDRLLASGDDVVVIDSLITGSKANLDPRVKLYEKDIRDKGLADIFMQERPDYVFHLAAQIDVRKSVENPAEDVQINLIGTLNVLESSFRCGVKKVIFASTGGAIYGDADVYPTPEGYYEQPLSPYGIDKLAAEKCLYFYKKVKGLDYTILRMSNVYGPRQSSKGEAGVIAIFISRLLEGGEAFINGDGGQTRDYVFVKDVVRAFELAKQKSAHSKYNVSTATEISVNETFDRIAKELEMDVPRRYKEAKPGEQRRSCLDHSRITESLGWVPESDIERGIRETAGWFRGRAN